MQPVVPPNGQHGREERHAHRGRESIDRPQGLHPLRQNDGRHDVIAHQAHESCEQRHDHAAIAELGARLNHLRQTQFRTLRRMKRLERGADHDAQRPGEHGRPKRQPEARTDEADCDGKKMKVAQEPEGTLIADAPMPLAFRYEGDGALFDRHGSSLLHFRLWIAPDVVYIEAYA